MSVLHVVIPIAVQIVRIVSIVVALVVVVVQLNFVEQSYVVLRSAVVIPHWHRRRRQPLLFRGVQPLRELRPIAHHPLQRIDKLAIALVLVVIHHRKVFRLRTRMQL